MSKTNCPAGCGKRFIDAQSAENHMRDAHADWKGPKRKGWATPYGFGDFSTPVTYEEAIAIMKPAYQKAQDEFKRAYTIMTSPKE